MRHALVTGRMVEQYLKWALCTACSTICWDVFADFGGRLHITLGNMNGFVGWLLPTKCQGYFCRIDPR